MVSIHKSYMKALVLNVLLYSGHQVEGLKNAINNYAGFDRIDDLTRLTAMDILNKSRILHRHIPNTMKKCLPNLVFDARSFRISLGFVFYG